MIKKFFQSSSVEKIVSLAASIYVVVGLIFAFAYATYYHWSIPFSYLSPPFFQVLITWPFQAPGFIKDILYYGLAGKPF